MGWFFLFFRFFRCFLFFRLVGVWFWDRLSLSWYLFQWFLIGFDDFLMLLKSFGFRKKHCCCFFCICCFSLESLFKTLGLGIFDT